MRNIIIIAILLLFCATLLPADSIPVYFGTYTPKDGLSQGIYRSTLDRLSGELSEPVLVAKTPNPSFLAIHSSGNYLYAVSESGRSGAVSAFAIDPESGVLQLLNTQSSGGNGPCFVNMTQDGKFVLVANYGSGSASVIPIEPDGHLAAPTGFMQHSGSSVNKQRQEGPHAHSINPSPDDRFVIVADLGLDKLMIYQLDHTTGILTPNTPAFATVKLGGGPRHFSFHPNGKFGYVINELNGTITAFSWQAQSGTLNEIQTVSTLPDAFKGANKCAEICIHPNGKFLYGSNRGHDSIAVYQVDPASGKLTFVEHEMANIKTPRNFNIDPSGNFCLVANMDSDSVIVFRIDLDTGRLTPTDYKIKVGKPVCIRFLP